MAVTITDRRNTVTSAESTTDWTGVGFGLTTTSAEGTNAVAESLASTTGQTYYTQPTGSVNLGTSPGTLVYIYTFNNALQDLWDASPPPNALLLGDGTDRIGFDMAGSDRRVFNHLEGPTGLDVNGWQCLVLDTGEASQMNTDGNTYVVAGTFAGLNFGAITQWGASFDTNSKALGGGYNVAVDIVRYGNDGIRITAGGSGTEGTCSELATADASVATGDGHGVFRELNPVSFGCQAPLTFGESGAATQSRFIDSGVAIAFEARNISDGKYYLNVEGNSGTTNVFELRNSTITTGGPTVSMDMSGGNINTLVFDAVSFVDLGNTIDFSANADASGHDVTSSTFNACGVVTVGNVTFTSNVVSNSTGTTSAIVATGTADMDNLIVSGYEGTANTSALIYNSTTDPDGKLDGASFTKGTAATHAIEFGTNVPTTMTIRNADFSGYNAANGNNDSTFHFRDASPTSITLNLVGCTGNFTYRTDGANITIVSDPVTTTVTVLDNNASPLLGARVILEAADATGDLPYLETPTSITRSGTTATANHVAHGIPDGKKVVIRGATDTLYNGVFVISVTDANNYTYTMSGTPAASPASGTITASGVLLEGLTDSSGQISDSRTISTDQPLTGRASKATSSPYFKDSPLNGVKSASTGLMLTTQLILDE